MATIYDVAELAGVSAKTISRGVSRGWKFFTSAR